MADSNFCISLREVTVTVPDVSDPILGPLSLDLTENRIAVIGANGSGKSTFLRLLNGLLLPSAGKVEIGGFDSGTQNRKVRQKVAFVFADAEAQIVAPTPREDVALSLRAAARGNREAGRTDWGEKASEVLTRFGLSAQADVPCNALSTGQRRLLGIASVLATRPAVLVCDEPTSGLDAGWQRHIDELLAALPHPVIIATHDLSAAARAERALFFQNGRVHTDGRPATALAAYRSTLGSRAIAGLPA